MPLLTLLVGGNILISKKSLLSASATISNGEGLLPLFVFLRFLL